MNNKQFQKIALSFFILANGSAGVLKGGIQDASDVLALGAVGAAVISASCSMCSWLLSSSDADIVKKASALHKDQQRFSPVCEKAWYAHDRNSEYVLSDIAHIGLGDIKGYLSDMKRVIEGIDKNSNAVTKSMNKKDVLSREYQEMRDISQVLENDYTLLRQTYRYLQDNSSYFDLFYQKQAIINKYERIIRAAEKYTQGYLTLDMLRHELRIAVSDYTYTYRVAYPFLAFVESITQCKQDLDNCIKNVGLAYGQLQAESKVLSDLLSLIRCEAMAQPEYAQDLRDRERDHLQTQNQILMTQLAYQQAASPQYVVEYVPVPEYTYVQPVPTGTWEYEVTYEPDDNGDYIIEYEV